MADNNYKDILNQVENERLAAAQNAAVAPSYNAVSDVQDYYLMRRNKKYGKFAVASLILGVLAFGFVASDWLSIFLLFNGQHGIYLPRILMFFKLPAAILSIVFGCIGIAKKNTRVIAIIGIILGIFSFIVNVLYVFNPFIIYRVLLPLFN